MLVTLLLSKKKTELSNLIIFTYMGLHYSLWVEKKTSCAKTSVQTDSKKVGKHRGSVLPSYVSRIH